MRARRNVKEVQDILCGIHSTQEKGLLQDEIIEFNVLKGRLFRKKTVGGGQHQS